LKLTLLLTTIVKNDSWLERPFLRRCGEDCSGMAHFSLFCGVSVVDELLMICYRGDGLCDWHLRSEG
jgi:hypothetical protein